MEFNYILPIGYKAPDGKTHREVIVKEMCGYDEEWAFNAAKTQQPLVALIGLLERLIVSIGEIKPVTQEVIKSLLVGDLNYLVTVVRCVSLGKDLEFSIQCPNCKKQGKFVQDLEQLERITLEDDADRLFEVKLEKGVADIKGDLQKDVTMKFLTVEDQVAISTYINNPAKAINIMLVKSIVKLGNIPSIKEDTVKGMVQKDRAKLLQAIDQKTPGVNLVVDATCEDCGSTYKVPLGIENFFGFKAI